MRWRRSTTSLTFNLIPWPVSWHPSNTEPADRAQLLQHLLLDAIEHRRPGSDAGATHERAVRRYDLLKLRYVEGLEIPAVRRAWVAAGVTTIANSAWGCRPLRPVSKLS